MRQCVELYLLVNFLADAAILGAVARANGAFRLKRVCLAAGFGAVSALASCRLTLLRHPILQATLLLIAAAFACPRRKLFSACQTAAAAFLVGGLCTAFGSAWLFPVGVLLSLTALWARRQARRDASVSVVLAQDEYRLRFDALIDTGNRLHEPVSGEPILILEEALWKGAIPERVRFVPFCGLGGSGLLRCFRVSAAECGDGRRYPCPWVGLYRGRLPGRFRALVPPSFIE